MQNEVYMRGVLKSFREIFVPPLSSENQLRLRQTLTVGFFLNVSSKVLLVAQTIINNKVSQQTHFFVKMHLNAIK